MLLTELQFRRVAPFPARSLWLCSFPHQLWFTLFIRFTIFIVSNIQALQKCTTETMKIYVVPLLR